MKILRAMLVLGLLLIAAHAAAQTLPNAANPLSIDTPDGYGQSVHPDVVYVPGGWHGYNYWMVMTPYVCGDDQYENPTVVVSQDGQTWSPRTLPYQSLVGAPAGGHNDDPDVLIVGGTMILYFLETTSQTRVKRMSTTDGVSWSAPTTVITATNYPVSPAVVYDGSYKMWDVYWSGWCPPSTFMPTVERRTSSDGITWSGPSPVTINNQQGRIWHIDVQKVGSKYVMLYATFPDPAACEVVSLYLATSTDGMTWTSQTQPVLQKGQPGQWDDRNVYRSSFVASGDFYRVWYSAASNVWCTGPRGTTGPTWHIGYTEGCLGDCGAPAAVTNLSVHTYHQGATLSWTAPGDDGNVGTVSGYAVKYYTAPINEQNFDGIPYYINPPQPEPAGSWQGACTDQLDSNVYYWFAMKSVDDIGNWSFLSNVVVGHTTTFGPWILCDGSRARTPAEEEGGGPQAVEFSGAAPNPATNDLRVSFGVPLDRAGQTIELAVYDVLGRRVRTILREGASPGRFTAVWDLHGMDGSRVRSGVYFLRFALGETQFTRTVMVK